MTEQTRRESIAFALVKFSLPLILAGILQQLYNWADAFIVGNVDGELSLAAVGATTSVINFYILTITGFTMGLSIFFAQRYGSGETEAIPRILSTFSLVLGAVFLALSAAGFALAPAILRVMDTSADIIGLSEGYLRIVFLGIPFLAVYNVFAAALRGLGDSRTPFLAVLLSAAINVALDIWFVAALDWNVQGAAAATVISQAAMTLFLVIYSRKKYSLLRFALKGKWFDKQIFLQGVRLGVPPMIQSSVHAFGSLILQNFMNGFGSRTVAAITTAYRVDTIVILPMTNLGAGISTMVAQSYGAGDRKRIRKIFGVGSALMAGVSLLMTALVIPFGGRLIALFGAGPEVVDIGSRFFIRLSAFYIVYGLATAIRGYIEGLGDVACSSLIGIAALFIRIAASYMGAAFFGNMIIAYAEDFSWVCLLIFYILRVFRKREKG